MQRERDDIVEPTGASAPGKPAARMDQPHAVGSPVEHFYATSPRPENLPASYALPEPPEGSGPVRWVPPGQSVTVAGVTIQGGMLYVGSREWFTDIATPRDEVTRLQLATHASILNKHASFDEKRAFYAGLRTHVHNLGHKPDHAARLYRERFGVWPRFGEVGYGPVTDKIRDWVRRHQENIALGPEVVNGLLSTAGNGHLANQNIASWPPNYSGASPQARQAYLTWLAKGRRDPHCDISLVFLFFFGLERHILTSSEASSEARDDWPVIVHELGRLLAVYGDKSGRFTQYVTKLLELIEFTRRKVPERLYEAPVTELPITQEVPFYMRLALGQAAADRAPMPAWLALAWIRTAATYYLRTPASRCPEEFNRLFELRYRGGFGTGILLGDDHKGLKFAYFSAAGDGVTRPIEIAFNNLPDVTDSEPPRELIELAKRCAQELDAYSRVVGADRSQIILPSTQLLLPLELMPDNVRSTLGLVAARVHENDGPLLVKLNEILPVLNNETEPATHNHAVAYAHALKQLGVGMEPNVLGPAKLPAVAASVVLFELDDAEASESAGDEYQTATLMLAVAVALANADGSVSPHEINVLDQKIDGWTHLSTSERRRLHAHVRWLLDSSPKLSGLKRKFESLTSSEKQALAVLMVDVAQSDGYISPEEVRFLQKIYTALGLDATGVFDDVHTTGAHSVPTTRGSVANTGFYLDPERIASLKEDTARVSALLTGIFSEGAIQVPALGPAPKAPQNSSFLGLDEPHTALARLLASKPRWARAELDAAAAALNLWLDGALEEINEAALAKFDTPLCEGNDLIDVDMQLLENMQS